MGQDDDTDCDHDWQLVGVHEGQRAPIVPTLDTSYECVVCGAVAYAATRPGDLPPGAGAT
jgi:hypothetical protein